MLDTRSIPRSGVAVISGTRNIPRCSPQVALRVVRVSSVDQCVGGWSSYRCPARHRQRVDEREDRTTADSEKKKDSVARRRYTVKKAEHATPIAGAAVAARVCLHTPIRTGVVKVCFAGEGLRSSTFASGRGRARAPPVVSEAGSGAPVTAVDEPCHREVYI